MVKKLKKKEIQDLKNKYPRIGEIVDFYQNTKLTLISVLLISTLLGAGVATPISSALNTNKDFQHLSIFGIVFSLIIGSIAYRFLTDEQNEGISDYINEMRKNEKHDD